MSISKLLFLVVIFSSIMSAFCKIVVPASVQKPTNYPIWAHKHWVWLHNDLGNQQNVSDLVHDYISRGIPVGAVNIDSTWETQYNNFEIDINKFPDFKSLVSQMHDIGVKVTMWATSMINVENPDYQMCVDNKFLVRNSTGSPRPLEWWHGSGGLLDYSNPDAVAWWHKQMDKVLDAGVDGFKTDGTDPYIIEYSLGGGALGYNDKVLTYRDYASLYYRDFLQYTREKRGGDNGLIMSRPVDCMADPVSKVCWGYSPKDVMFSGWVGDDDSTFNGLRGCARKVIYSAWENYANFGCDIGGYRGDDSTKDKELFIRWAQFGSFLPLMENGGGGEHRPWMYDDQTTTIYRSFALEHHRLSPYFSTAGANAMDNGVSSLTPLSKKSSNFPSGGLVAGDASVGVWYPQPETFAYLIGEEILVNPVLHASMLNSSSFTTVDAVFPIIGDEATRWLNWWHPSDMKQAYPGSDDRKVPLTVSLDSYPVHVRQGSLMPLESRSNPDEIVFTWFGPNPASSQSNPKIAIFRESASTGSGMEAKGYFTASDALEVAISAREGPVGLEIVALSSVPASVSYNTPVNNFCVHEYLPLVKTLKLSCKNNAGGVVVSITGVTLVYV